MKSIPVIWAIPFLAAACLTGCGDSSELATPADLTADEEAKAELEYLHVENEERMHQEETNGQ